MAVWLDVIGSFIFGTLLLLNVLRMNADVSAHAALKTLAFTTHNSAAAIAEIVEDDLRKAGMGVGGTAFLLADSAQVRFLADLGMDGIVDTVYYYAGNTTEASATVNPGDRFLYRDLSGQAAQVVGGGVTDFSLSYFGAAGDSLALPVTLANVRQIRLDFTVESASPQDTTYAETFMQLRLFPKNL